MVLWPLRQVRMEIQRRMLRREARLWIENTWA